MRLRRLRAGTSLIEVLTVIVVFLVGILAVVQIFPPGLRILRDTKNNTIAASLAKSEIERLSAHSANLPEMIVPVGYIGSERFITPDPQVSPDNLDAYRVGQGEISQTGNVIVGGVQLGNWARLSGPNRFARVIGEGGPVSAPRAITPADASSAVFGSLIQLMFAPMVYDVDPSNGNLGKAGEVVVYGNDLAAKAGDQHDTAALIPEPNGSDVDTSTYYYIPSNLTQNSPAFVNEDQIWIPAVQDAGLPVASAYRIKLSFEYTFGTTKKTVDAIVVTTKNDTTDYFSPTTSVNFSIISLKQLIALQGYFGTAGLTTANYLGVVPGSISVERVYDEVLPYQVFSATNPYQYEVISLSLGSIVVSPLASSYTVHDDSGEATPLFAKVDYSVYDWRILRDEFRAPTVDNGSVKLALNSIKSENGGLNPDGLPSKGIGGQGSGDYAVWTPDVAGNVGSQDFVIYDMELGAVIIGNQSQDVNNKSAYYVDKGRGNVIFKSVTTAVGMWAYVAYPKGDRTVNPATDANDLWHIAPTPVNISGHPLRALYRANGEYAVQVLKAAKSYRISYPATPDLLQVGECYAGGTNETAAGAVTQLYFPTCDFGQKVVIGEIHLSDGTVLKDQDLLIDRVDLAGGKAVDAYATLPNGASFATSDPYAVRWVRGASIKVRSLWNTDAFALTSDTVQNYQNFINWSHGWHKNNAETVDTGGMGQ